MASPLDQLAPAANVDITVIETSDRKEFSGGRRMWGMWLLLFILILSFVYITLLSFPGPWLKTQDQQSGACVVDYCKLYGYSVFAALLLLLLCWIISWAC